MIPNICKLILTSVNISCLSVHKNYVY